MWVSESDGVGEDGNYDGQIPGALRAAGTRGLGMPGEVCFRGQEPLPAQRPAGHRERAGSQGLGLPLGERWDNMAFSDFFQKLLMYYFDANDVQCVHFNAPDTAIASCVIGSNGTR